MTLLRRALALSCLLLPLTTPLEAAAAPAAPAIPPSIAAPASPEVLQGILKASAEAMVTIEMTVEVSVNGESFTREWELNGLVIDARGLVVTASRASGGLSATDRREAEEQGAQNLSVTPKEVKVRIGTEVEPINARFLARDSDLDLAWLQLDNPNKRSFVAMNPTGIAAPGLGQPLITIQRTGTYFGHHPMMSLGRMGNPLEKPRRFFTSMGGSLGGPGTAVLAVDGKLVGLYVAHETELDSKRSREGRQAQEDSNMGLILPFDDVLAASRRALASTPMALPKP